MKQNNNHICFHRVPRFQMTRDFDAAALCSRTGGGGVGATAARRRGAAGTGTGSDPTSKESESARESESLLPASTNGWPIMLHGGNSPFSEAAHCSATFFLSGLNLKAFKLSGQQKSESFFNSQAQAHLQAAMHFEMRLQLAVS